MATMKYILNIPHAYILEQIAANVVKAHSRKITHCDIQMRLFLHVCGNLIPPDTLNINSSYLQVR